MSRRAPGDQSNAAVGAASLVTLVITIALACSHEGTTESAQGGAGGAVGEGGGSRWDMIGGCPAELCPSTGLPAGETCAVTVTCCEYQRLSEGIQGCTCTDGRWICGPQR